MGIRRHLIHNATVKDITNISWKKDSIIIDLQSQERMIMGVEITGDLVVSTLLVVKAVHEDAGQYSCTSHVFGDKDFPRARVQVHVIQGDHLAVQGGSVVYKSSFIRFPDLFLLGLALYYLHLK